MSHRNKLPPNAPCPCGSDKEYGDCCHDKGFDWVVDEDGNIGKSIPVSDELAEVIKQQHQKFVEEFGREPGPEDNLFFNMPHQKVVEHVMVEGMKQAGFDPAIIYAFEKTMSRCLTFLALSLFAATSLVAEEIIKAPAESEMKPIFNGKDLTGWDGDPRLWSVKDGAIHGETTKDVPANGNTFLIWQEGNTKDFELRLSFRCNATNNSGIQYRSKHIATGGRNKWVVRGYQHEIRNQNILPSVSGFIGSQRLRAAVASLLAECATLAYLHRDDKPPTRPVAQESAASPNRFTKLKAGPQKVCFLQVAEDTSDFSADRCLAWTKKERFLTLSKTPLD